MIVRTAVAIALMLALLTSGLSADTLKDSDGDDSGWSVTLGTNGVVKDIDIDHVLDVIEGVNGSMTLKITKDFVGMDGDQFPVGQISFIPSGTATSVPKIIIQSEDIENNTGYGWTSYHWVIMNPGVARFNIDESSGWTFSPYTALTWENVSDGKADGLFASEGIVLDGATFSPSGGLVIDIDVGAPFTFKQSVVPEPATMLILLSGIPAVILRKARRRA